VTKCSVEGCENPAQSRGWCRKHYQRWYRYGDPNIVTDQSGKNNSNYRDGTYCEPHYCKCGREKDRRSNICATCAGSSYSMSGEPSVENEKVIEGVAVSKSYQEAAQQIGISRQVVTRRVLELGLDTSHFRPGRGRPIPTGELLTKDGPGTRCTVRQRVLEENLLPYLCESCGIDPEWNGKELILQLDHINGDSKDHRLENLRWLCPNCHSQTPTYTGKKK
jgi:hypothetical protein